jgi:hypothetical protein
MRKTILQSAWFLLLFGSVTRADRGVIPFHPDVRIFEPRQNAVIAWDGQEEILLLSTDLNASQKTKVLEVLPLPSEPNVTAGDIEVFLRATHLINLKLARKRRFGITMGSHKAAENLESAGEITFHEKIGAHDISVTRVINSQGFVEWVDKYLKSEEVDNPVISDEMKTVIKEYLEKGFTWFVFDVVELDEQLKTNDAIQYKFKTDFLYYPLKITRVEHGWTTIDLLILTPKLLSEFEGIPQKSIILRHHPIVVYKNELKWLSEDMYELLSDFKYTRLRIWRIRGELKKFDKDLVVKG